MKAHGRVAAWWWLGGVVSLGTLLLAGVLGGAAHAARPTSVRLSYGDNIFAAIPTVALEQGIFLKHGLSVNAFPQPRAQLAVESLVGGSTDFATAISNRLVFAADAGLPIVAIALGGYGYVAQVVVPARDQRTRTMADLVGKRIGVQVGSGTYAVWVRYLQTLGLSPNDFRIVNLDTEVIPSAFEAGQLDAAVLFHPFTSQVTYTGLGRVVVHEDEIAGAVQSTYPVYLLTRRQLVQQRPDVVLRFVLAWVEATHWVETHRDETLALMTEFYQNLGLRLDQRVVADMLRSARFDRVRISEVDIRDAQENIARPYLEAGRIRRIPDLALYIDSRFVDEALGQLGLQEPLR